MENNNNNPSPQKQQQLSSSGQKQAQKLEEQQMRQSKIKENEEKMTNLAMQKSQQSSPFFKDTKIVTCSQVLVKNGQAVAVAFRGPQSARRDFQEGKSTERDSLSQQFLLLRLIQYSETFKLRNVLHAGQIKKPLEPYSPNAHRSRMYQPQITMPYKNSSQIVIGDRSSTDRKHFVSMNKNLFIQPNKDNLISNQGIIAEKKKWLNHLQNH